MIPRNWVVRIMSHQDDSETYQNLSPKKCVLKNGPLYSWPSISWKSSRDFLDIFYENWFLRLKIFDYGNEISKNIKMLFRQKIQSYGSDTNNFREFSFICKLNWERVWYFINNVLFNSKIVIFNQRYRTEQKRNCS